MVTVFGILIICKALIIHVIARRRPYVKRERIEMFDFLKYFLPKHFLLGSHKYGCGSEVRNPEKLISDPNPVLKKYRDQINILYRGGHCS
jgi:hypothetical protein